MHRHTIIALIVAAASTSCGTNGTSESSDVLVAIGNDRLSRQELSASMPGGLSEDDSTRYARAFIRSWIDSHLVTEVAAKEIDMTDIDRLVEQYRRDLIAWEYNRMMYDSREHADISEDSIRSYYESHAGEFRLDRPMVKGIFIKVANDSESLAELREIYPSSDADALDKIEKTGLKGAMHYDFFMDRWIYWERIESLIPYEFGDDADAFTESRRSLDHSDGAYTYLLNITEVLHSGQPMPLEAARPLIEERLKFRARRLYDLELKERLFGRALESGALVINCEI